jgi:hypothetical protein
MIAKAEQLAVGKVEELIESLPPYVYDFDLVYEEEYEKAIAEIMENDKFQVLSSTYYELFEKSTSSLAMDFALLRHLLRRAARYRIRNLVPLVLSNFERLLPVLRESIVYLNRVINKEIVIDHQQQFNSILSAHYMRLPFVNLWISYLLQNQNFNDVNLLTNYDAIHYIRGKALIAMRRHDTTWVKSYRDGVDVLGPWDKRAVLYSSSVLSSDEMKAWAAAVGDSGDIIDKSLALFMISQRKPKAQ